MGLKLVLPRYPALTRGRKKNKIVPQRIAPIHTVSAAKPSARASFFSELGIEAAGGISAPVAPRRNSRAA